MLGPEIFPAKDFISGSTFGKIADVVRGKYRFDPTPLEKAVKRLVNLNLGAMAINGDDTPFRFEASGNRGSPKCKVFVCVTSEKLGKPFRFRSYESSWDIVDDCPIWQACRATSAAPTFFPPIFVGNPPTAYVDGGLGYNNPIRSLVDEATKIWPSRGFGCIVSIGTGVPPPRDVGRSIKPLLESLQAIATDTEKVAREFKSEMKNRYGVDQKVYFRFNVRHGLEQVGLEEWKDFDRIQLATRDYLNEEQSQVEACACRLYQPSAADQYQHTLDPRQQSCLQSFRAYDYLTRLKQVPKRHPKTLSWLARSPKYMDWLNAEDSRLLAITGPPGCGKTVLSASVVHSLSEITNKSSNALLAYSFCDDKIAEQRTAHSILRTIIVQILLHQPQKYLPKILPEYNTMKEALFESLGTLWEMFKALLDVTAGQMFCVIDGLDECEELSREFLLDRIQDLFTSAEQCTFFLKLAITSRSDIEASWSTWRFMSRIKLEDYHSELEHDVGVVIDEKISEFAFSRKINSTQFLDQVRGLLRQKSGGTFLWVDLVLRGLLRGDVGSSEANILEYINATPHGLNAVYASLLAKISKTRIKESWRMLTWITFSIRPLKLEELEIALAIEESDDSMVSVNKKRYHSVEYEIVSIIGPFVKILGTEVHMVHQSAKQFLLSYASQMTGAARHEPRWSIRDGHLELTRTCLRYLTISGFHLASKAKKNNFDTKWRGGFPNFDESDGPGLLHSQETYREQCVDASPAGKKRLSECWGLVMRYQAMRPLYREFPFLEYAGTNWCFHAGKMLPDAKLDEFGWLSDHDSCILQQWECLSNLDGGLIFPSVKIHGALDMERILGKNPSLVHFATYFGIRSLVKDIIARHERTTPPSNGMSPRESVILIASYAGEVDILREMLQDDYDSEILMKAVVVAAEAGQEAILKELLKNDIDQDFGEALVAATLSGYCNIVEILLELQISHTGVHESLMAACVCGHEKIVRMVLEHLDSVPPLSHDAAVLLIKILEIQCIGPAKGNTFFDERVLEIKDCLELDFPNGKEWTPLIFAAIGGRMEIVSIFLKKIKYLEPQDQALQMMHALCFASGLGHCDVVKFILGKIYTDLHIRRAMFWACAFGQKHVVKALFDREKNILEGPILGKWTSLQLAALGAEEGVMRFLLDKIDAEAELEMFNDENGCTLIFRSMQNKNKAVFELLAERFASEFSLKDTDNVGRTALSYAAEGGGVWAVNLCLRECPKHQDHEDNHGRTPLSYAAEQGHTEIVQLLFKGSVGNDIERDNQGRSPLWYASKNSHSEVIRFLQDQGVVDIALEESNGNATPSVHTEEASDGSLQESDGDDDVGNDDEGLSSPSLSPALSREIDETNRVEDAEEVQKEQEEEGPPAKRPRYM